MTQNFPNEPNPDYRDVLLRVGAFVFVAFAVLVLASGAMARLEPVVRSAASVFLAGLIPNLFVSFQFASGRLGDFGLGWDRGSGKQLSAGLAIGICAVGALVSGAILVGFAAFQPAQADWSAAWVVFVLFLGALGEELLFRGYAFQYLLRCYGAPTIIGISAVLFGLVHLSNSNVQLFGVLNTMLWGALLGYAYTRAQTLWLAIGLHYGWNLALALLTSNVSGLTIRATAWDLQWSAGELWSGGGYGLEGGLLAAVVVLPVFLLVRRVR